MRAFASVVTVVLVILYPVAIWIGLTHFSARTVGLWIVALLVPVMIIRFRRASREDLFAALRIPLLILAVVLGGVVFDDERFVLATPVLISVVMLFTFASSLATVPIIERFARMIEKGELPPDRRRHCRQATWAWCVFFLLNGLAAATLALAAPISWWAAYNGGIVYGLMGLMFAGEYVVRQYRFRSYGSGLHDRLLARVFPPREGPEDRARC